MNDFNFFEKYQIKKERGRKRAALLIASIGLVIFAGFCVFTVYYAFEQRIRKLRFVLEANELFLRSQNTIESIEKYETLNARLNSIKLYNNSTERLAKQILSNSYINTDMLAEIELNIPKDTRVNSVSFDSSGVIAFAGISEQKTSIAKFEYNLNQLSFIGSVFVSSINYNEEEEIYTFSMSVSVKDVVSK